MSSIDELSGRLREEFPGVELEVRKHQPPLGVCFISLRYREFVVVVETCSEGGFGVSSYCGGVGGLCEAVEWFGDLEAVFGRVVALWTGGYD